MRVPSGEYAICFIKGLACIRRGGKHPKQRAKHLEQRGDLAQVQSIDVYSINGQKLKTLTGVALNSYSYTGADLSEGMYLVRLTRVDRTQQTIKWMIR